MTTNATAQRRPQPLYLDGAELKRRREAAPGLSQTALAAVASTPRTRITQNHIAHWEAGHYGCGIEVIKALADALPECEPTDLMHTEGRDRYAKLREALAAA
jgi:predicted transcriptional regulator